MPTGDLGWVTSAYSTSRKAVPRIQQNSHFSLGRMQMSR